jgi:vitamin B12 transporter
MTRPRLAALLCGSTVLLSTHALAQTGPDQPVETVTITATRLPAPLSLTPGAYVVGHDQIQQRQSPFIADVLAAVPGVSISESGAFGGVSSLRLRGASSDKTLVLIDGVPVNDPSAPAGGYDFSSTDASDLERVEVLTGPQGSLWGSDAIGGVVAITTREPNGLTAFAEGGSLTTTRGGISLGHATSRYAFGLVISTLRTDGISKADARDGNPEIDGFNTTTVSANARVSLTDKITLDARARYNAAATEYDAGFGSPTGVSDSTDSSDVRTASGYVRLQARDVLGFDHSLRADLMDLDRQYHGDFPFGADGDQQLVRWSAERQRETYGLAFGVEHKGAQENTGDGRETQDANGYYAIGRWTPLKALNLTGSVRRDDPQHYQGQTTGRIAGAYEAGAGFTLKASWGQGFKAPSIFETTYPCFECATPGPAKGLKPEHAEGWDVGAAWVWGGLRAEATYFDLRVRDQINYLFPFGYSNIDRVRSTGVEAGAEARLPAGFTLRGSYTHDDAVDGTGARLLRVPQDIGTAALGWQGRGWQGHAISANLGLRAQAAAQDVDGTIKPFNVAYLNADVAVTPSLSLNARIENLTDQHYQQAFGYGEPGRMVMVGLRWRP